MKHLPIATLMMIWCMMVPVLLPAQAPVSKQATLVETISSSEVLIEATGIYVSAEKNNKAKQKDVENNGIARAIEDAKRSAVWFLLVGGTDPMLRTPEEVQSFETRSALFYGSASLNRYVTYEDVKFIQRLSIDGGNGIRVTKRFKLNKELVYRDLENAGILSSRQELSQALGRPQLMVIPVVPKGQNPMDLLRSNPVAKHSAGVIESHLTAKQYEVLAPQQIEQLVNMSAVQSMISGSEEDISYQLALSIGSDIYITFAGAWEQATYNTQRYSITVRAFETTSGRLLGSETGYSQARQGESMISVEEAINGAVDAVLSRIESYWRDDLRRGVQYKLILSISSSYSDNETFDIQDLFLMALKKLCNSTKENVATPRSMDLQVWVDPGRYDSSRALLRDLRQSFNETAWGAQLNTITLNRKLIQLRVD